MMTTGLPDLVGRRIVRVDADGAELRSLELDDGTRIRFLWRVGTGELAVGIAWEPRARRRGTAGGNCGV